MNLLRLTWPVVVAAGLTLGLIRFSQADGLNIEWSGAYLLKLDAPATDVIIANPLVADVTVQAPDRLVIIGKLPGVTRLIVMNEDNVALDTQIVVSAKNRSSEVSVYRPDGANITEGLFACSTDRCTPVPGTGRTSTGIGGGGGGGGGDGGGGAGPIPQEPTVDNLPPSTPGEPTY
jgi:uncharacterized membrane protein YgcG